jgi:ABC-type uncharacterized transport system involved in gliding motility auxiliary subunit
MNKKILSGSGIALAVVLLLAVNILSGVLFKSARLDLTDNKLYTLSQGTRNILKSFDEPITLRFYFSEKLANGVPALSAYGKRVREMLEEYASVSDGKVKLVVMDPEPFSEEEDQAVQDGLKGVPIDNAGSTAYFGLVGTNATDDKETIPFFQQEKEASLEYDVTRLVYKLSNPKQHVVGVISSLPIEGAAPVSQFMPSPPGSDPWMVVQQMKQQFDVRFLDKDVDNIPSNIDVLMLVHPKALPDKTLFAIDQFVLNGGRALVFVDPLAEVDRPPHDPNNPMAAMSAPRNSDLKKLFDSWGVELVPGQLATDIDSATRVGINRGPRPQSVEYVAWLQLGENNFDRQDFVTGDLKKMVMASPGYFKLKPQVDGKDGAEKGSDGAELKMIPLIQTSARAMSVPVSRVQFRPDPVGLLNSYKPGKAKLTLAARLTGTVKTAFPGGPPKDAAKFDKVLKESKQPINVIVVADADMLEDRFWVNVQNFLGQRIAVPRANNGAFVVNAIDNLSGNNDLISLRSRSNFSRPFEKVKEIQRDAEQQFRDREKQLEARLNQTEQKLRDLQRNKSADNAQILSPEQEREIEQFQEERVKTRKELRNVQHELRKNIEALGTRLKFINIGLVPILIILFAIGLGVYRHKRMNRNASHS